MVVLFKNVIALKLPASFEKMQKFLQNLSKPDSEHHAADGSWPAVTQSRIQENMILGYLNIFHQVIHLD